jgi:hypothetical protein
MAGSDRWALLSGVGGIEPAISCIVFTMEQIGMGCSRFVFLFFSTVRLPNSLTIRLHA